MKGEIYTLRAGAGIKLGPRREVVSEMLSEEGRLKWLEKTRGHSHWGKSESWAPGLGSEHEPSHTRA